MCTCIHMIHMTDNVFFYSREKPRLITSLPLGIQTLEMKEGKGKMLCSSAAFFFLLTCIRWRLGSLGNFCLQYVGMCKPWSASGGTAPLGTTALEEVKQWLAVLASSVKSLSNAAMNWLVGKMLENAGKYPLQLYIAKVLWCVGRRSSDRGRLLKL